MERPVRGLGFGCIVLVLLTVGVYRARCGCSKTFQSDHRRAPKGWRYTREVRQVVLDSVVRDRMPVELVQRRVEEDFSLRISTGFVYQCVEWGYAQLDQESYRAWALANFSGVLCIDELHDSKRRKLLLATDPINDFTVAFRITKKCDQEAMNGFLDELKALGFEPEVVITDGSSLYKEALFERWSGVEHQLCIFHVLKGANEYILPAVRALPRRHDVVNSRDLAQYEPPRSVLRAQHLGVGPVGWRPPEFPMRRRRGGGHGRPPSLQHGLVVVCRQLEQHVQNVVARSSDLVPT